MTADPSAKERRALCCFCADVLDATAADAFQVTISKHGLNGSQSWFAHESCLASALHPGAQFEGDIYWKSE